MHPHSPPLLARVSLLLNAILVFDYLLLLRFCLPLYLLQDASLAALERLDQGMAEFQALLDATSFS
jgi:hypothetical protein